MPWYVYSIIVRVSFSAMVLIVRKVRELGFSSIQVNIFLFGFVFSGSVILARNDLGAVLGSISFGTDW